VVQASCLQFIGEERQPERLHHNMGEEAQMQDNDLGLTAPTGGEIFERVVSILEQARANVVRSVNNNMVIAYWLIGREIV